MGCRGHLSRKTGGEGGDASHRQRPRRRREIKPAPRTVSQQCDDDPNNIPSSPQRETLIGSPNSRAKETARRRGRDLIVFGLSISHFPILPSPFPFHFCFFFLRVRGEQPPPPPPLTSLPVHCPSVQTNCPPSPFLPRRL